MAEPRPWQKYKRCHRCNEPRDAHALTFSCFHRQPFLRSERACKWLIEALDAARRKHAFDLWAYVLMPQHVHLVLWPTRAPYSISSILASIKLPVTRRAVAWVGDHAPAFLARMLDRQPNGCTAHRFWERGGGYDRNLHEVKLIHREIEYVHLNPVRRALTERPEDWPWSSAAAYAGLPGSPLMPDVASLPAWRPH